MKRLLPVLLPVLLCAALGAVRAEPATDVFQPRTDHYDIAWGSIGLGHGSISIAPLAGGCYRFESVTHPAAIVRWTYGAPRETSEFCIDQGRIVPRHFEYVNDKREKDSFRLDFDWKERTLKTLKHGDVSMRELTDNTYDRFVIQLALRQWLVEHSGEDKPAPIEFKVADHRRIKSYRFALTGRERVQTPAGAFDTLLVERVDDSKHQLRFWVAPSRGYVPVKVQQIDKGETKLQMLLRG
jgi:hypothetical protein